MNVNKWLLCSPLSALPSMDMHSFAVVGCLLVFGFSIITMDDSEATSKATERD